MICLIDSIQNSSNSEAETDDVHSENENIEELNHPLQEDRSSEIEGAVDDEESDVNSLYEEVIEDGEDADHHDLDPDLLHFLRARSITQLSLRGFSSSHGCGVVIENRRVARQINPLSRQVSLVFLGLLVSQVLVIKTALLVNFLLSLHNISCCICFCCA